MTADIKTAVVADLLNSVIGLREKCADEGFSVEALSVVRFHDNAEQLPWFYRQVETLGYVAAVCEGGRPLHADKVLADVRAEFGADVSVLWV
jgi:hypothetical protein